MSSGLGSEPILTLIALWNIQQADRLGWYGLIRARCSAESNSSLKASSRLISSYMISGKYKISKLHERDGKKLWSALIWLRCILLHRMTYINYLPVILSMCLVKLPKPPKLKGDWIPDASPTANTLGSVVCSGLSRYVGNIPTIDTVAENTSQERHTIFHDQYFVCWLAFFLAPIQHWQTKVSSNIMTISNVKAIQNTIRHSVTMISAK